MRPKSGALHGPAAGLVLAALALSAPPGCGQDGRLLIKLALPTVKQLDPTVACVTQAGKLRCDRGDPRLARFNLRIGLPGGPRSQESLVAARTSFELGQVPVGRPFDLRLAGLTSSGQTLGMGVVHQVDVTGEEETVVAVQFRKPIGYVAGAGQLLVLDVAAASSANIELTPLSLSGLTQLDTSLNGTLLATVDSGRKLGIYRTSDHKRAHEATLPEKAACVRISPDNRFVFVCQPQGLAVLELAGTKVVRRARNLHAAPSRIAFAGDGKTAWILTSGASSPAKCSSKTHSSLLRIDYGPHRTAGQAWFEPSGKIDLPSLAGDVEVHPRSGKLLVSFPCDNVVRTLEPRPGRAQLDTLVKVPRPYEIEVTDDHVVVLSRAPGSSQGQALLLSLGDQQSTLTRTFDLPTIALTLAGSADAGKFSWASEPQPDLEVYRAQVTPDGQRALLLYRASYRSNLATSSACSYRTRIATSGILAVDLTDGSSLFERFTKLSFSECYANCIRSTSTGKTLADRATCEAIFRRELRREKDLSTRAFTPAAATLLFGGQ